MHKAIQQVRGFLQINRSRFEVVGSTRDKAGIREQAGFLRCDPEDGHDLEYLIFPAVFKKEVCKSYSYRPVLKELQARGYLKRTPPDFTIKPRLPRFGTSMRVYCLRATILGGDE